MIRGRAVRRKNDIKKAIRKRNIDINCCYGAEHPMYDNLHQYSDNKVHCSCPMCSEKTRNKGRRTAKNYNRAVNYKPNDLRIQMSMDDQEEEKTGKRTNRPNIGW